ncbi:MAG: ribosome silencing factor [Candidatus Marinimicrobia bacterium]|jgi:ribosome-associated protein|nr:ribosome silencing factor [Gammaproteobacteria bacterium]MBT3727899.1 ribosome silencing factor [Candidatus Neomarinimicrobiota bacterium]MBT3943902.1 ribosome silencing factor [Candidatus Neomarinimicrobiota bacterium]MBT4111902.1 ribosome silencing factor [Candidatus Neomarinimicrobiota bacterium]MBT4316815.1 ribosome silencing factor [Candidatus Neomarinimicrobiota bacterium]
MKTNPLLKKIVGLAEEKKAEDLVTLNVSKITSLSDYFVICSAKNLIQVKAIADNIKDNIKEKPFRTEGYQNANWIIIDYVDIVVHIFFEEAREYYDLERLWFDAKTVKI